MLFWTASRRSSVDPRARLRRYLEQRREMGESELVLDSLTVDEALRIVGGEGTPDLAQRASRSAAVDWREMLRTGGAGSPATEPRASPVSQRPPLSPSRAARPGAPPSGAAEAPRLPAGPSGRGPTAPTIDLPQGLSVGSGAHELFGGPLADVGSLEEITRMVHGCRRCPLFATATQGVPGEGPSQADLMAIGEAPGATEDATGRPFVGAAGQLLTKILAAVDMRREDVYIANVMKHRPPGNRNPSPDEVAACTPYLVRQIELLRPKVILALGTFAAQTLLSTKLPIGKLRGHLHRYHGVPLIVTYHPAALLRNPGWKRPTWEDVQLARRILDRAADA